MEILAPVGTDLPEGASARAPVPERAGSTVNGLITWHADMTRPGCDLEASYVVQ